MLVTRYMTDNRDARIVAMMFSAPRAELLHDDTIGEATIATREEPGDTWGPPRVLAGEVSYFDWVATVAAQGFEHEERSA